MEFVLISIGSLVALGIVAAVVSLLTKGGTDAPVVEAHDCSTCSSVASGECKIGCLLEQKRAEERPKNLECPEHSEPQSAAATEKKQRKDNKTESREFI